MALRLPSMIWNSRGNLVKKSHCVHCSDAAATTANNNGSYRRDEGDLPQLRTSKDFLAQRIVSVTYLNRAMVHKAMNVVITLPRLTIFSRRLTLYVSSNRFAILLLSFLRVVI